MKKTLGDFFKGKKHLGQQMKKRLKEEKRNNPDRIQTMFFRRRMYRHCFFLASFSSHVTLNTWNSHASVCHNVSQSDRAAVYTWKISFRVSSASPSSWLWRSESSRLGFKAMHMFIRAHMGWFWRGWKVIWLMRDLFFTRDGSGSFCRVILGWLSGGMAYE